MQVSTNILVAVAVGLLAIVIVIFKNWNAQPITTTASQASSLTEVFPPPNLPLPATTEWGTYRPGIYFGVKARAPQSPAFGIMWFDPSDSKWYDNIRHDTNGGEISK